MFAKLAAPNFWGLLVRLAFHDAGTHSGLPNATARFQGANGSIRFELGWDSNAGVFAVWPTVEAAAKVLEAKYGPDAFSYADLIALAGAAAVRKAGGPAYLVGLGRVDATHADERVGPATDPGHAKDFDAGACPDLVPVLWAFWMDAGAGRRRAA